MKKTYILLISSLVFFAFFFVFFTQKSLAQTTNIVLNPSVEIVDSSTQLPVYWLKNSWGTNTAKFSYLSNDGYLSTHSLKTEITSYSSGDAKWYFSPQNVLPSTTYQISDYYKSNITTEIDLMITNTTGTKKYIYLGTAPASSMWTKFSFSYTTPSDIKTLTVFHLVESTGWLITDEYSVYSSETQPPPPQPPPTSTTFDEGIVTLNFDDGWASVHQNALPLLVRYQTPVTLFITTSFLGDWGYMTNTQLQDFKTLEHEIASHTVNHPNLTTLSLNQINYELFTSKQYLETNFGPVTNFATPYGAYNSIVIGAIKQYYRSHRSTDGGYNTKSNFDIYNIKVKNIKKDTTTDQVNSWIQKAKTDKSWLVIVYHQVDTSSRDAYSTTPYKLEQNLISIKKVGIKIATLNQALDIIQPQLKNNRNIAK